MAEPVLYYFNSRGKAECIRLVMCFSNIKFRDVYLSERKEMEELIEAGKLQFGQVPLLEMDGMKLVQSGAILRYLANKGALMGKTPKDAARIDLLFEGTRDLYGMFLAFRFGKTEEMIKEDVSAKGVPKYLPKFNKVLEESGTGVLVGSSISLADLGLYEAMLSVVEFLGDDVLNDYPHLQKFMGKMNQEEQIKVFLEKHRKAKNTEALIQTVRKVLAV